MALPWHTKIHAHGLASDPLPLPLVSSAHACVSLPAWQITNLASGLPLGFALGRTFQPLDVPTGRFENIGQIEHKLGLATASTLVIGDVRRAPLGTLNAAGTVHAAGNRVDVDFRRLVFGLDSVLGRPLDPPLRKVIVPQQKAGVAQPANDVTYLDGVCRVTRGGDDSLFIFRREPSDEPMLSLEGEPRYARRVERAPKLAAGRRRAALRQDCAHCLGSSAPKIPGGGYQTNRPKLRGLVNLSLSALV